MPCCMLCNIDEPNLQQEINISPDQNGKMTVEDAANLHSGYLVDTIMKEKISMTVYKFM